MKNFIKCFSFFVLFVLNVNNIFSQFVSGDVFREYSWYNETGDAGQALRIGEGEESDYFEKFGVENIDLPNDFDLTNAIKAELVVEKIESHAGTNGLKIRINDSAWIPIPEVDHVPQPQYEYMQHVYPVASVPLSYLKQGTSNKFRMEVDTTSGSPWAQNIVNGLIFRVYYDSSKVNYPKGKILTPSKNDTISGTASITTEVANKYTTKQVDYIGYYEGISYEGDSLYTKWHYHYYHTEIHNHIGTSAEFPFSVNWNTDWVPDQQEPIKIMARIISNTDLIYVTEIIDSIILTKPEGISVELCKPYNVPVNWVTRRGNLMENINIKGDTIKLDAAKLIWTSWAANYENDLLINNLPVAITGDFPKYQYYVMEVDIEHAEDFFVDGVNVIRALKPSQTAVHGMEIQYPGIMALIKYNENILDKPFYNISSNTYKEPQKIYIGSKNIGADIRYTLNGSIPNSSSTLFTDSIEIDAPVEIKARCFKPGADSSRVVSLSLNFKPEKPNIKITKYVDGKAKISISTILDDAEIRYNIDSDENPDKSSNLYTGEIEVDVDSKIKAIVYKDGWQDGSLEIFFVPPPSGIGFANFSATVSVFPNPASDQLNIQIDNALFGYLDIKLTDILGNVIKTETVNKTKDEIVIPMSIDDLKQGTYILQLNQKGNTYAKIIVK